MIHRRKKHIDVDKPIGYGKYKIRRWCKLLFRYETRCEIQEELDA